jgi:hypothetical protein
MARAGQDLWYEWKDGNSKKNGYSHELYTAITHKGKPALKSESSLKHIADDRTNHFSLTLVSSEIEPLLSFELEASEIKKDQRFTTRVSGKPEGLNYLFSVNRNGKKESIAVPRSAFEYFDFEDNFLYGRVVPGKSRTYKVLNTFTLGVEQRAIKYVKDETIKAGKKKYDCRKYTSSGGTFSATIWRDKKTDAIVKQVFSNGSIIQRTSQKQALKF